MTTIDFMGIDDGERSYHAIEPKMMTRDLDFSETWRRQLTHYYHLSEVYNNGNLQKSKKGDLLGRIGGEVRPRCEDPKRQRRAALLSVHGSFPFDLPAEAE